MQQEITDRAGRDFAIDLEARAIGALGSTPVAWKWLQEPRREFDGLSARELMLTDLGREQVEMAVERLEWMRRQYDQSRHEKAASSAVRHKNQAESVLLMECYEGAK